MHDIVLLAIVLLTKSNIEPKRQAPKRNVVRSLYLLGSSVYNFDLKNLEKPFKTLQISILGHFSAPNVAEHEYASYN